MRDGIVEIINKKRYYYRCFFLGIVLLLLFLMAAFFYNRMYFGEYKYPHKNVYTFHDYFIEMREDGVISEANFKMYMYSAFNVMLENREVEIDSRIVQDNAISSCLMPIKYSQENMGVLNLSFDDEKVEGQKYYLLNEDGQEQKMLLFTGEQWEQSSCIKIFYNLEGAVIIAPEEMFEDRDFVDMEIESGNFSCEKVLMQTQMDATIQRIEGTGHKREIVIRQLLFILFIASIGIIAGTPFLKKAGSMAIWFIFPFGFMSQIFSTLLLIFLHLKISFLSYALMSYAAAVVLNMFMKKHMSNVQLSEKHGKWGIVSLLLWVGMILWLCIHPYIILSYDSVLNAYYGNFAAVTGELNSVLDRVLSFSLITPLYEVGSALFEIELNYSIQPILTLSFMAAMGWIWVRVIKKQAWVKAGILLWGILALAVNPMFFIQTFWKLNNLSLGMFVGISVGMHLLYYMSGEKAYFKIGNLFFAVVCIARIEGGVFAVVHLVCLYILFQEKGKEKDVERLCLSMALLLTALFVYCLCVIGQTESDFWTPQKGLAMNIFVWLVYLFFKIIPIFKGRVKKIANNIDKVMPLCILFALLVFGIINREKFIHNMFCYICNLGNYGGYWVLVIMTALYGIFWRKENPVIRFLSLYLVSYFFLIPGLMIFRSVPLRIGFGDSACRMLSHIVIVGCYLLIYFVNDLFMDDRKTLKNRKRNDESEIELEEIT